MQSEETTRGAGPDPDDTRAGEVVQGLERLVFFSDAVFAIALTLLALDLKLPTGETDHELWHSFYDNLGQSYFAFALSFVVITMYWAGHHRLFTDVVRFDRGLIAPNMVLLFMIITVPFATRVLAEEGDSQLATVVYASVVAATALSSVAVAAFVWHHGLVSAAMTRRRYLATVRGGLTAAAIFAVSIPIAFVDAANAKWTWLALAVAGRAFELVEHRRKGRSNTGA